MNSSANAKSLRVARSTTVRALRILGSIMSSHTATDRVSRCLDGGTKPLSQLRAVMSEVQISGVPKLSSWEVAST